MDFPRSDWHFKPMIGISIPAKSAHAGSMTSSLVRSDGPMRSNCRDA